CRHARLTLFGNTFRVSGRPVGPGWWAVVPAFTRRRRVGLYVPTPPIGTELGFDCVPGPGGGRRGLLRAAILESAGRPSAATPGWRRRACLGRGTLAGRHVAVCAGARSRSATCGWALERRSGHLRRCRTGGAESRSRARRVGAGADLRQQAR